MAHPYRLRKCKRPTSDTYRYTELLKGDQIGRISTCLEDTHVSLHTPIIIIISEIKYVLQLESCIVSLRIGEFVAIILLVHVTVSICVHHFVGNSTDAIGQCVYEHRSMVMDVHYNRAAQHINQGFFESALASCIYASQNH